MVQWWRLCAPNSRGSVSTSDQGTRFHMPQLRVCVSQLKDHSCHNKDTVQPKKERNSTQRSYVLSFPSDKNFEKLYSTISQLRYWQRLHPFTLHRFPTCTYLCVCTHMYVYTLYIFSPIKLYHIRVHISTTTVKTRTVLSPKELLSLLFQKIFIYLFIYLFGWARS